MKISLLLAVFLLISCNSPTETKSESDLSLSRERANSIFKYMNLGNISELRVDRFGYSKKITLNANYDQRTIRVECTGLSIQPFVAI